MTISALSDLELSRWIAEKIEPSETLPHVYAKLSPLAVWECRRQFTGHTFQFEWQPRDMVNDPAMTMLLQKILIARRDLGFHGAMTLVFDSYTITGTWMQIAKRTGKEFADVEDLGRAWAEAFALANGWEESHA